MTGMEWATDQEMRQLRPIAEALMKTVLGLGPEHYILAVESRLSDFVSLEHSLDEIIRRVIDAYHLAVVPNLN